MKVTNLVKKGIIDPVKVTRLALENAASVAGTILLTECTITQDKQSVEQKLKILQGYQNGNLSNMAAPHEGTGF